MLEYEKVLSKQAKLDKLEKLKAKERLGEIEESDVSEEEVSPEKRRFSKLFNRLEGSGRKSKDKVD